jgi:OOP family OmpA-OmpF porin
MTFLQSLLVKDRTFSSRETTSSSRAWVRTLLAAAVLVATAPTAFAQIMLMPVPGPVHEEAPPLRAGHMWHHGNWQWAHGRYVWVGGAWVAQQPVAYGGYPTVGQVMPETPPPRVERLSADALFPFDRGDVSDIRPAGWADLSEIAAQLRAHPFSHVEVRGYTDRLGSDAYNLDLSRRRAEAVKAVLIHQGVPPQKIRADGLGSQDPVTQCGHTDNADLVHCLQPDRRVEIITYVRN